MNQLWNIDHWNLRNKFKWYLNQNWYIFQENAFEIIVCKMAAILSRPQCVNTLTYKKMVSQTADIPFPEAIMTHYTRMYTLIAKLMRQTWGPSGSCRSQMGPMLALWTLLSGYASLACMNLSRTFPRGVWPVSFGSDANVKYIDACSIKHGLVYESYRLYWKILDVHVVNIFVMIHQRATSSGSAKRTRNPNASSHIDG